MNENTVVYEFKKNSREIVRVEFSYFMENELISLRIYFCPDQSQDKWLPTKKGIALNVELLPELKKAVDRAVKEWQEMSNPGPSPLDGPF